jgi:PAS domain S-box-containing protein
VGDAGRAVPQDRHFEALVDSSQDAILSKSNKGIVTSWNRAAARLYGYSSAEVVGRPISIIVPPERRGEEQEILRRIVAGERIDHFETERVRKDGRRVHVSLTVSPIRDEGGELLGASVIARDITDRRRAEERAKRLREVVDALSTQLALESIVEVVLEQALPIVGADAATFGVVSEEGDALELVGSSGHDAEALDPWKRMSLAHRLPLTDAIRSGAPVWSDSPEQLVRDYPALAESDIRFFSLAAIPLVAEGKALGAISLSFVEPHDFTFDERSFLLSIAHEAAHALARGRLYERERHARAEAEAAREAAEGAREQLEFLAQASALLGDSLDPMRTLRQVGELAVPHVADWCGIDLLEDGRIENVVTAHVDPAKVELAREFRRRYPPRPDDPTGLPNVLRTGRSELYPEITEAMVAAQARDPEHLELMRTLALRTAMIVPLTARGRTLGALTFISSAPRRRYDQSDLTFAEDLARRAALALDNARHYRHERDVAVALQESLLPERLPDLDGVKLAAKYLSGTVGVEVGGDWYDVVELGDERVAFVMGDVAGRGARAASAMGHLRTAIRAYSLEGHAPADVVGRVGELADTLQDDVMATMVYVSFDRGTGEVVLVNAGHPPSVLRRPGGEVELLASAAGHPITALPEPRYGETRQRLEAGTTLVLYTDGLVERRGEGLDEGLRRLAAEVGSGPADPGRLCTHLIETMLPSSERPDDVAILVVGVGEKG